MMKYKFIHVPVIYPQDSEEELNQFLASQKILSIDKQFISAGEKSGWSFCVAYELKKAGHQKTTKKGDVDYREVLNPTDFDVFSELRRLRKQVADELGVPPYTVFSNQQLATMVTRRVSTIAELRSIDGVGESRCDRFGQQFLNVLCSLQIKTEESTAEELT